MNLNNINGISVEHDLDESDFSEISSVGMDLKQMAEKIQKLEVNLKIKKF